MAELIVAGMICIAGGAIAGWLAASRRSARTIAFQREQLAQAHAAARTDLLTGLWNRAAFEENLQIQVAVARRYGSPLALILVDLDCFKQLNDLQGHPAGDELLVQLARLWRQSLRESDFLARWGGDEFAMLLPQTDGEGAAVVSDRIRTQSQATPVIIEGRPVPLLFSAGIATFSPPESPEEFVKRADEALYRAKRLGGNRAC